VVLNAAATRKAAELIPSASFDVSFARAFGAFSGSLLLLAALGPWAGKAIDRTGHYVHGRDRLLNVDSRRRSNVSNAQ
jgi:hypothetical protein